MQIAWALYDAQSRPLDIECHIIRPVNFTIPHDAYRIHGISTDRALAEGRPIRDVLTELAASAALARVFVAHNVEFDANVLAAEYLRAGLTPPFAPDTMICTMKLSTNLCRIPGYYGWKWPRLEELYRYLFGAAFDGVHDAGADVAACASCFFELKNRGVIATRV